MDTDEWFFNSFNRYNELQMFDFPKPAKDIDLTSINNLCVALEDDTGNRNEILIFSLPSTLQTNSKTVGMKFDRHLSFDRGYFTESQLIQMKCIPNQEYLIISERNGVSLFDVSCKDSDLIKKVSRVPSLVNDNNIAINCVDKQVALCSLKSSRSVIVNYESMDIVSSIEVKDPMNCGVTLFSSRDIVSFANPISGQIDSYDVRSGASVGFITIPEVVQSSKTTNNRWIFNSTFEFKPEYVSENLQLQLFSTNGNFLIYDTRNITQPLHCIKHTISCETSTKSNVHVNVCPVDFNKFIVCGFDEKVYVCELNNDKIDVIFTHDGHSYSDDGYESTVQTVCSMWLPSISPNTVVSCAHNSSVQCWQYIS